MRTVLLPSTPLRPAFVALAMQLVPLDDRARHQRVFCDCNMISGLLNSLKDTLCLSVIAIPLCAADFPLSLYASSNSSTTTPYRFTVSPHFHDECSFTFKLLHLPAFYVQGTTMEQPCTLHHIHYQDTEQSKAIPSEPKLKASSIDGKKVEPKLLFQIVKTTLDILFPPRYLSTVSETQAPLRRVRNCQRGLCVHTTN